MFIDYGQQMSALKTIQGASALCTAFQFTGRGNSPANLTINSSLNIAC